MRMLLTVVAATFVLTQPTAAQDTFRGKAVTLFAGQPPGGGIDFETRLVGHFLGKQLPGQPAIVVRNMPGAGGLILGNHLFSVARPDGLTLGMPGRSGFVLAPIINAADTKYDLRKFTWIGSSTVSNFVMWMRKSSDIKSLDDMKKAGRTIVIAGSGSTTANSIIPEVLGKYENIPIKVVRGYPGIADAVLAVERGEADGVLCQRASIRPDMLSSGTVVPAFQLFDVEPGVPILEQLVVNEREKRLLELLSVPQRLGLPLVAPPGVPGDVTQVLRESYLKMVATKEYQDEAIKRGFDIGTPNAGEAIAAYVANTLLKFPEETVAEYQSYVKGR